MNWLLLAIAILNGGYDVRPELHRWERYAPLTLFDFNGTQNGSWQVVNDGVMGGRSNGAFEIKEGTLRFTGNLVTRGGGFTSLRAARTIDLTEYEGLELRVRGGGRTFELEVGDNTRLRGRSISRRTPFVTSAEWSIVRLPFNSLRASIFGQPVTAPPVNLANVTSFGLYILDGIDGPFRCEIDWIRAYRSETG